MFLTGLIVTACCLGAGENLLANGGFETLSGDLPAQWHLFVLPQPGAVGRVEAQAHAGARAVMLHTPMPYDEEPVNNWSQNVFADMAGKKLEVRGYIKTKEAGEAAIWVQCWRRGARLPQAVFSTKETAPVYGTRDWEAVSRTFDAPAGTYLAVVRCVLLGTGSAWFDDVELSTARAAREEIGEKEENRTEQDSAPDAAPTKKDSEKAQAAPAPGELDAVRKELGQLREANLVLAEALEELRRANAALLEHMRRLEKNLDAPRPRRPAVEPIPAPAPPRYGPHGIPWTEFECN